MGRGRWRNPARRESTAFLATLQRYEWIYGTPAPEAMKRCAVDRIWWRALKATEAWLVLSVFCFLSPWLQPFPPWLVLWLCSSSQRRGGTNPLFLTKSLARRWCEDVLSAFLQRQLWALSLQPEIGADLWAIANTPFWDIWGSVSWKDDWNGGHCKQDVRQPLFGCHPAEC